LIVALFVIVVAPAKSTPFPYTTLFRSHADDFRRRAPDGDRVDLGRIPDRLILVSPLLRVVAAHGIGPDIAGIDLRDPALGAVAGDRKSTRLNSSHRTISYAVFCLKKKI